MGGTEQGGGGLVDRLKGKAKQVAGSVLGDKNLKEQGQLHEAKADAAADARRQATAAEHQEAVADVSAKESELAIERQRLATDEAADARAARIETERKQAEAQVAAQHDAQRAAAERQAEAQENAVDQSEAAALRQHQVAEADASRIEREATEAERAAAALDAAANRPSPTN